MTEGTGESEERGGGCAMLSRIVGGDFMPHRTTAKACSLYNEEHAFAVVLLG
jgi:hypothetical protein